MSVKPRPDRSAILKCHRNYRRQASANAQRSLQPNIFGPESPSLIRYHDEIERATRAQDREIVVFRGVPDRMPSAHELSSLASDEPLLAKDVRRLDQDTEIDKI